MSFDGLYCVVDGGLDDGHVDEGDLLRMRRIRFGNPLHGDQIPIGHSINADAGGCCKENGQDSYDQTGLGFEFH